MPHVETPQTYELRGEYPHLGPADAELWNRFIAAHPARFVRVWYDFRVGDEDPVDDACPAGIRECWWDLTYWRIDVVAEDERHIFVIEVKPRANAKAIGQAKCYSILYTEDESPAKPVVPVVLTDQIIATTARVAAREGVLMWKA